jgi:hypothetical protein
MGVRYTKPRAESAPDPRPAARHLARHRARLALATPAFHPNLTVPEDRSPWQQEVRQWSEPPAWHGCHFCLEARAADVACDGADCGMLVCEPCLRVGGGRCPECASERAPLGDNCTLATLASKDKASANAWLAAAVSAHAPREPRCVVLDCGGTEEVLRLVAPRAVVVALDAGKASSPPRLPLRWSAHAKELAEDETYDVAFYDACATYSGSAAKGVFPRMDMRRLWQYMLRRGDGARVVAMTISLHEKKKKAWAVGDEHPAQLALREQVALAARFGWLARPQTWLATGLPFFSYCSSGPMAMLLFVAHEDRALLDRPAWKTFELDRGARRVWCCRKECGGGGFNMAKCGAPGCANVFHPRCAGLSAAKRGLWSCPECQDQQEDRTAKRSKR